MKHLNEEELLEHYWGEDRDPGSSARHLADCAECAESYTDLQADLSVLEDIALPVRDPEYGQRVWRSIARSLPEQPYRKPLWMLPALWRGLAYAAAVAVLVATSFYSGRMWEHAKAPAIANTPTKPPAPPPQTPSPAQRVVVVVLSDHLDRSERLLVELKHADANDSETLAPLSDEARILLPANRICQKEARSNDDPQLEKALVSLDHLLAGLASRPEGLNAAAVARLQDEMKAEGMLFEVRVLRARIPSRSETRGTRSVGGTI